MSKIVILVVEDEALIRMNTIEMIEDAGYDVVAAADVAGAIDILERRNDVAILFTDINMPGSLDGLRLAQYVGELWPSIRVVITSGKTILRDKDIPPDGRFLLKPYSSQQIEKVLHELVS
jgi:CheY-like chemotaxis protein